ncbi:MAG: phage holin family protein [Treponema sp.]|nr:phage holin family protein [Treponema sp.]
MKNNKILKSKGGIILIIVFALIFLITSVLFKVFGITDIWAQLTGTLLGTIITAIVTVLLLGVQTNKEIGHDRDVGIFEKKQEVYFDFIETLEQITQDGRINVPGVPGYIEPKTDNEINDELQHLIYQLGKLQMTANPDTSKDITEKVGQIIKVMNDKSALSISEKYSKFAGQLFQIVSILRNDMYNDGKNTEIKNAVDPYCIKGALEIAGLDVNKTESDEEVLANFCDLMVSELKEAYPNTSGTHIDFLSSNRKREAMVSIDAAKAFYDNTVNEKFIDISTPVGNTVVDIEIINSNKNPTGIIQVGVRKGINKGWNPSKKIPDNKLKKIGFAQKDSAFLEFKSADENGRKDIVKEVLQKCDGLKDFLEGK